jgi:hypothetical protein
MRTKLFQAFFINKSSHREIDVAVFGNRLGYLDFDASFLFIFLVKNTISKHSYILYYIIHFLLLFKQKIHYKIKFFSFFHTTKIKYYTNHLYLL